MHRGKAASTNVACTGALGPFHIVMAGGLPGKDIWMSAHAASKRT